MPAGSLFMIFFFAEPFMAAFMSLISMVELAVRGLQDLGFMRNRSLVIAGGLGLAGIAVLRPRLPRQSGLGVGHWAPIPSGLMFAFVTRRDGLDEFRRRYVNLECNQMTIGRWWNSSMGVLVPAQGIVLLAWFFWATFPPSLPEFGEVTLAERFIEWLRPDRIENVGTVLCNGPSCWPCCGCANRWMERSAAEVPRT